MKNKFAPTTIWAFQAAIAIILALLIGNAFHLERPYWAVVTSLLLISQTWGESLKKALERVAMTILGGIIGTSLYLSMSHVPIVLFFVLIFVTFFMIYFIGYSFLLSAFFVTIFVVFLFAILGNWSTHILEVRIYETMIGAATAVGTSIFIFPTHSNFNLQTSFKDHLSQTCEVVHLGFDIMDNKADRSSINQVRDRLYNHFRNLSNTYKTSSYEMFFMFIPRKKARVLLNKFAVLLHYVTSFLETTTSIYQENLTYEIQQRLKLIQTIIISNLEKTILLIENSSLTDSLMPIETTWTELLELLITTLKDNPNQQDYILNTLSAVYYLKKINETLLAIETQLKQI